METSEYPAFTKGAQYFDAIHATRNYSETALGVHLTQPCSTTSKRLLDVGCGTGGHLAAFQDFGYLIEGLDISPDMLKIAKEKLPDVPLHLADLRDFKLDTRFDLITCFAGPEAQVASKDELTRAIANIALHLKDTGIFFLHLNASTPEAWDKAQVSSSSHRVGPTAKLTLTTHSWRIRSMGHRLMHYHVIDKDTEDRFTEQIAYGIFSLEDYVEAIEANGLSWHYPDPHVGLLDEVFVIQKQ